MLCPLIFYSQTLYFRRKLGAAVANLTLFDKLGNLESRYAGFSRPLGAPEVHNDSARFQKLAKTHAEMAEMVAKYREWKEIQKGLQGAKQLLVETDDTE